MKPNIKRILLVVLAVLLLAEVGMIILMHTPADKVTSRDPALSATDAVNPDSTSLPTETMIPTDPPTEPPTEPPVTEPPIQRYTLSFAGDCTLGSTRKNWKHPGHFVQTIGENYDYPFDKVRKYFEKDDFTIINLEGPLTDDASSGVTKEFVFRGPTAYTQIMTGSSVEAVTLANNHSEDYGKAGYDSTVKALKEAGIAYVEEDKTTLYTTESGLIIGLYADAFYLDKDDIEENIRKLKDDGAEIIICAFHWGNEAEYQPTADQQKYAKIAIDAGANVVYGHHPHVLQPIEEYNGGLIFYSVGNFSFGGAAFPKDYDTALLQLEVIRDENGNVYLGDLTAIPCTIKSESGQNSFQPTPLKKGTEFKRILKKLGGNFTGKKLNVTYGPPETAATETVSGETVPAETVSTAPVTGPTNGED